MAHTRRRQVRALAGEAPKPTPRTCPAANDLRHESTPAPGLRLPAMRPIVVRERAGQLEEFEQLLPVLARHYGYAAEDISFIRQAVTAPTPIGEMELALCVRQWQIDVVTYRLDSALPEGAARRARIEFRQCIMAADGDENGERYDDEALDFNPETPSPSPSPQACDGRSARTRRARP